MPEHLGVPDALRTDRTSRQLACRGQAQLPGSGTEGGAVASGSSGPAAAGQGGGCVRVRW